MGGQPADLSSGFPGVVMGECLGLCRAGDNLIQFQSHSPRALPPAADTWVTKCPLLWSPGDSRAR